MRVRRGYLIAVEGVDGAGKTTQARRLVRHLNKMGLKSVYTYEPTNGPVGRLVRRHLRGRQELSEEAVALLFAADRLEHLRTFVMPYLKRGFTVVSDRYLHSSVAYQTALTDKPRWVEQINSLAPEPDLSIFLDLPVKMAVERLRLRRSERYERVRFLRDVRRNYLRLVRDGRMVLVDGSGKRSEVAREIAEKLEQHLVRSGR